MKKAFTLLLAAVAALTMTAQPLQSMGKVKHNLQPNNAKITKVSANSISKTKAIGQKARTIETLADLAGAAAREGCGRRGPEKESSSVQFHLLLSPCGFCSDGSVHTVKAVSRMNFTLRENIWSTLAADVTSRKSRTSSLERKKRVLSSST